MTCEIRAHQIYQKPMLSINAISEMFDMTSTDVPLSGTNGLRAGDCSRNAGIAAPQNSPFPTPQP